MTEIKTLVYGIYPKTENLRRSLNRWERGKLPASDIKRILKEEKDLLFSLMKENRITHFTDPLFNWYDIFRPIALLTEGIEIGPLTRYKETNTFYRLPVVGKIGTLKGDPKSDSELESNPPLPLYQGTEHEGFTAFLPSPVSFYRMARIEGAITSEEFAEKILSNYGRILDSFGVRKALLFEPQEYDSEDLSIFNDFAAKYSVTLVTTGNLNEDNFDGFRGKFESIIAGNSENNLSVAAAHSKVPGLALIDAHNTKLEKASEVRDLARKAGSSLGVESIVVANSDYLDYLPRSISDKKIRVLSEIGD